MITKVIVQDTDFHAARLVQDGTIEWEAEQIGQNVAEFGTCRFETRMGAVLPFVPKKHMYVEMRDEGDVVRFAGRIKRVTRKKTLGVAQPQYAIEAQDWMGELAKVNVTADFIFTAGDNDKNVITQLVALYWGQIATTGVTHRIFASHHNLPAIQVTEGQSSFRDVLNYIGGLAGASCWVTPDKGLRWNDVNQLAAVILDDTNKTGSYRAYYELEDIDEATDVAFRVTVIGAGGVLATITDWVGYADYARQRRYERGTPAVRVPQINDHTDSTLTTVAQCEARGWILLEQQSALRTIKVGIRDTFVYPGEVVDLIDAQGLETRTHAWLDDEDLWAPGQPTRLNQRIGRFQVRSVRPQPLGGGNYDYVATLGAYRPAIEQILRAA